VVAERRSKILEYVIDHERVDVNELSERFGVSQVTVRKTSTTSNGTGS